MKATLPSFLKIDPYQRFSNIKKIFFPVLLLVGFLIRAWSFGNTSTDGFIAEYFFGGWFLFELILFVVFFVLGGKKLTELARFQLLYLAFVPNVSFAYLGRVVINPTLFFELRDDATKGSFKLKNCLALWYPNALKIMIVLVPFFVLLLLAYSINTKDEKSNSSLVKIFSKEGFKTYRWYFISVVVAFILLILPIWFANMMNLNMYVVSLIITCCVWKLWENIRKHDSIEPMIMVEWAEIALFAALWLKGLAECFGF